ncbi:MAG: PAS domain-containing sensor histidine kinase [Candidatus Obscuribacterales bacterium]
MGLAAKLNFAFFIVIVAAVLANAGYQLFAEFSDARNQSAHQVEVASTKTWDEFKGILSSNRELAARLAADSAFQSAWSSRDKGAMGTAINNFASKFGIPGYITVITKDGKVFYSSDSPNRSGYSVSAQVPELPRVLADNKTGHYSGALMPTEASGLGVSNMQRLKDGDGVVVISQPINTQFLMGLQQKLEMLSDGAVPKIDFIAYDIDHGRVQDFTPDLQKSGGGYIQKLQREGAKAIKQNSGIYEDGNRMWRAVPLIRAAEGTNRTPGVVLTTAPIRNVMPRTATIILQAGVGFIAAILLAIMFSVAISSRFNNSVKFLIKRAKDLAANKPNLHSLEGRLQGEWLELAEIIDTAVAAPRSSVQNLRGQINKYMDEVDEKSKMVDQANSQVEATNRQLMMQSRQLSELSKQMNYASQQAVVLQQKLASVLMVSTEGFLLLDQYGNVLSANPIFLTWMGVSEGEIAGRFCFDLVKKPGEAPGNNGMGSGLAFSHHGGAPGDLIQQFYPEGVVHHTYEQKKVDVLAHLHPIVADGGNEISGYVMVLRDKSIHGEVARMREDITNMLSEQIRGQLVTAEQRWKPILTNTSSNGVNPALGQALVDLHNQYTQLLGIVDSYVMMYGGFVPASITPREQVSVTRLIGECMEQVSQTARQHQILLDYKTVTGLPTTAVDKEVVRSVVVQLLEKAIQITAPGGRVRVESTLKGNEIRVQINSSGPAVVQDDIEDMFVGFIEGKHAEDSYSQRLSLYLARNNVERMGGRVWSESEAGRGTTLYCTLPVH